MKNLIIVLSAAAFTAAFADDAATYPKEQMAGTWLLNGTDKSTKFVLNKNGTFAYAGWGATSKGKWAYDGTVLRLTWTEIDGQKVESGKVAAKYSVSPEGVLRIDKYFYRKS